MTPTATTQTPRTRFQPIVFYDGECGFCSRSVRTLLELDQRGRFFIAPITGETFAQYATEAERRGLPDSIHVMLRPGKILSRSDALIAMADGIGGGWRWLATAARVIPRPLRDLVYRGIALNRHRISKLLGGKAACGLPKKEWRARMLP